MFVEPVSSRYPQAPPVRFVSPLKVIKKEHGRHQWEFAVALFSLTRVQVAAFESALQMNIGELYIEEPFNRALGSLFKLTEVFLWDDWTRKREKLNTSDNDFENIPSTTSDCSITGEDVELNDQLNALGLPLAFHTNKEKKSGSKNGKNNTSFGQSFRSNQYFQEEALEVSKGSIEENTSLLFDDDANSSFILGQCESSGYHATVDSNVVQFSSDDRKNSISSIKLSTCVVKGLTSDGIMDANEDPCDPSFDNTISKGDADTVLKPTSLETRLSTGRFTDLACNNQETLEKTMEYEFSEQLSLPNYNVDFDDGWNNYTTSEVLVPNSVDMHLEGSDLNENVAFECGDYSGDWMVCWDTLYMQNYFFNIKTHESTWYPPPGFEQFVVRESGYESSEPHSGLIDLNCSPSVLCTDMCSRFNESTSIEKPMDDNELIQQSPDGFSIGTSSSNFVSKSNVNMSTTSHELLEPSDDKKHTGSEMKRSGVNEVCTADSELACTDRPDNDCTVTLLAELHSSILHNKDGVYSNDDEGLPKINSSRLVQCHKNAVAELIMHNGNGVNSEDGLESQNAPAVKRRKKKVRRMRGQKKFIGNEEVQLQEMVEENSYKMVKYWYQRYLLFSKFDDGIKMDEEGWFSVTPESIARHHASRCGSGLIIDGFTGVGGNAIQFAQMSIHVTAIDIDPQKIQYARHNAAVYGVEDQIDFVTGDFFVLAPSLKADAIFLSPPWGGPDYAQVDKYDIKTMLKPLDGYSLFKAAMKIAPKIVMFLPRNVNLDQLADLSLISLTPWSLEVEKNYLNGKLKAITAYFTDNLGAEDEKRPTKFTGVNLSEEA